MSNVPTFISIYDNALSKDECNLMIDEFEISKHKWKAGLTAPSYEPDPENKISTEIFHELDDDTHTSNILVKKLRIHCKKYIKEYSDVDKLIAPWTASLGYNIQKYNPGEGYFTPHCEVHDIPSALRTLVWMFYLNDVPDGGTNFPTYNMTTDAVEGRLVLWPPYWTHAHHGIVSHTQVKYIATGWFAYQYPEHPSIFDSQ